MKYNTSHLFQLIIISLHKLISFWNALHLATVQRQTLCMWNKKCSVISKLYFSKINSILHTPLPHILITKPVHLVSPDAAESILSNYGIVPKNLLRSKYQIQVRNPHTIKVLSIVMAETNVAYSLSLNITSGCRSIHTELYRKPFTKLFF